MRLYLECSMGASGDMLLAALYELLPEKETFHRKMAALNLPGVTFEYSRSVKCGISGTHITVRVGGEAEKSEDVLPGSLGAHDHNHGRNQNHSHGKHRSFNEIIALINNLELPDNVKSDALGVYNIIGAAESSAHSVALDKLHLHEVGALDAVADIVGCCILINMLGVSDISASAVRLGSGQVHTEHGIMPVPAPATARILTGVPVYGGDIAAELCTPTGAALIKHFAQGFGDMPPMTVTGIGYGMGTKDFAAANCLRAYLGEDTGYEGGGRDEVFEISCNLDDMTPEAIGAAMEVLHEGGALDVWAVPAYMKKNRPGIVLCCLGAPETYKKLSRIMLEHTTTLGVRVKACRRDILDRTVKTVKTRYGDIRIKTAEGYGVLKTKPEYEDVKAAAERSGVSFTTVYNAAAAAAER